MTLYEQIRHHVPHAYPEAILAVIDSIRTGTPLAETLEARGMTKWVTAQDKAALLAAIKEPR